MESGEEDEAGAEEAMLWSIQEALEKQTLQIGASACGATAVVDVLNFLGVDVAPEEVDRCVQTRLRRNESPLADYLLSRSVAGVVDASRSSTCTEQCLVASPKCAFSQLDSQLHWQPTTRRSPLLNFDKEVHVSQWRDCATHAQLITGAEKASKGKVLGRFFHLHPRRRVSLVPWLASWIKKGAVPVATMNMQLAVPDGEEVPDAWHHQLIFGVAPHAVFMTNPLDFVHEDEVHQRLCSGSVLLIRREDVLQRLTSDGCPFSLTEPQSDPRWTAMDVEGQVRQMVWEEKQEADRTKLTHITIPAAYSSGITLFALRDSKLGQELLSVSDLPVL